MTTGPAPISGDFDPSCGRLTLAVKGDLVSTVVPAHADALGAAIDRAAAGGELREVTVDLTSARMVDSVGLNLLVGLASRLRECGVEMAVLVSRPTVHRAIVIARLDAVVKVLFKGRRRS